MYISEVGERKVIFSILYDDDILLAIYDIIYYVRLRCFSLATLK